MSVTADPNGATPAVAFEDPEARSVRLQGAPFWAAFVLSSVGIFVSVNQIFNLGLFGFRPVSTGYYYLMIGLFLAVGFLAFPARKGQLAVRWYDWALAFTVLAASVWMLANAQQIIDRGWNLSAPQGPTLLAGLYVVLALEGLRRTGEWILFIFCLILAAYPLYAGYMPGFLWGVQLDLAQTVTEHTYGLESIIGIPMQVVTDTLVGFIVFGVILANTGGGTFFMDFASAVLGKARGGPAKVAIFSSGLFGMLSGSPTSNVLTTGTITIPTMKRCGYPASYAGAVEACASTGGCIMPPVMGAAAFIMASFLNVPYAEVVVAAFLPALLFYAALMLQTDFYAARNNLVGMDRSEVPPLRETLRIGWHYILALIGLTYLLLAWRIEAAAPFWVSLFLLAVAILRSRSTGFNLRAFCQLTVDVGQGLAQLVCLIAGIGLIIGAMSITGVANSFSRELVQYAGGNVWLLLAAGAATSFVLGMGMTASACYIFLAIVLAPALIEVGIDPMAAHMYIFYWGMVSFITPPVALAAIAAASIAKADAMAVGFKALRIGSLLLLLPVLFVLQPALIMKGETVTIIQACATATVAVVLLAASFEGYLWRVGVISAWVRIGLGIAGLLLFIPEGYTDVAGAVIGIVTIFLAAATSKRGKAVGAG
ncbi:MAG: TRAP transporter fused permease subunit [Burkholderiaceae bacterium]|nr:TRAP transporter fused permease subunit [Burkholderiaceae bacterium]MEB2318566.1 TRAP transporter fused permease subunit [Pseudomonadota bacterium]